jgi:hypothetical protein
VWVSLGAVWNFATDAAFAQAERVVGDERDGVAFGEGSAAVVDGLGRGRFGGGHASTVP